MEKDKSHDEQVKRWAEFCRDNPNEFRKHLIPFLDSQIILARRFYERLLAMEDGKEVIMRLMATRQNNL